MAAPVDRTELAAQADTRVAEILRAADSWAREAPPALTPAIRAVCVRLAEMVADQRHYLAPLPEPQETERRTVLDIVAEKLRSEPVIAGDREAPRGAGRTRAPGDRLVGDGARPRASGSPPRSSTWRAAALKLPEGERPDPYWADDVVAASSRRCGRSSASTSCTRAPKRSTPAA